jgi:para-aminobenzoate synthetase / 4-amino-4-deoxychorismate lyase
VDNLPHVTIRDAQTGRWLRFGPPRSILVARRLDEVLPALAALQDAVDREGLHAAGFVSYEASPAFDAALSTRPPGAVPLLWFGLFDTVDMVDDLPPPPHPPTLPPDWSPSLSPQDYRAKVARIRDWIRDGDTYQVNFTYRLRSRLDGDPWDFFLRAMAGHEMPYAAFIDTGEWAVCSASPELFFRLDGDRIESRPMKGTAPRGLWFADDCRRGAGLRASAKDRAENVMIVDMVRNDIGRVADAGSVQVPALFEAERYPTLWQMTSTVTGRTSAPAVDIFRALFPPASITGAPKRRTMEIIAALEDSPRGVYTGTIGFLAPGRRAQFNVAIRTVVVERVSHRAEYGVGSGVVWDSRHDLEREECGVKSLILHAPPPAFDLLETLLWSPGKGFILQRDHLGRLARSAAYFGFRMDLRKVRDEMESAASQFPPAGHRVRVLVTRRGAVRVEATPIDVAGGFADVALAKEPVDSSDPFLYHKTTHRAVYEAALRGRPGFEDVLLFNERGEITESTIANVVVEKNGHLLTPALPCGLLPGTARSRLVARGEVREAVIRVEDLPQCTRVRLVNSVRGIHPVKVLAAR